MKKSVLVLFDENGAEKFNLKEYDEVLSGEKLSDLVLPGNIYKASALLEELPTLTLADGTSITDSMNYKGYQMWWMHNGDIFRYFCLPYTQYRPLLEYLKDFDEVVLYKPPSENLFLAYLKAHKRLVRVIGEAQKISVLPVGVLCQVVLTALSLPFLLVFRRPIMVYTGDKFDKGKDYDFRMKFVYEELRDRNFRFVEFIRGIEPWGKVLSHAWTRRRPVIYADGVTFVARFLGALTPTQAANRRRLFGKTLMGETSAETRFKFSIATQYVMSDEDIWASRIMAGIIKVIGLKAAFIPAASERSLHTVIGAKINNIPTVGIMHGVQTRQYNPYDFLRGFKGAKKLTVDAFGVWSDWWRSYYLKNSDAYAPEQLVVSGPMRPLVKSDEVAPRNSEGIPRVLFVAEEAAVPEEVLPYLRVLLGSEEIQLTVKFRPYRDGFEQWLIAHEPELLKGAMIARSTMQEAFREADVAVGCQSTGVMEAVFQKRVPIYFRTEKWGDYFEVKGYGNRGSFFAENPEELLAKILEAHTVSDHELEGLCERFFGNPYKNGSGWVVDQLEELLKKS